MISLIRLGLYSYSIHLRMRLHPCPAKTYPQTCRKVRSRTSRIQKSPNSKVPFTISLPPNLSFIFIDTVYSAWLQLFIYCNLVWPMLSIDIPCESYQSFWVFVWVLQSPTVCHLKQCSHSFLEFRGIWTFVCDSVR